MARTGFWLLACGCAVAGIFGPAWNGLEAAPEPALKVYSFDRLNTKADEDDPCPSPDGFRFYYTANAAGHFDLMMAERRALNQPFDNPRPLEELNTKADEVGPCALPRARDGSEYLYFASQRDAKNFDIFFTRRLRSGEPFQRIAIAPVHQVCTEADEAHPCVTPDLLELYFSRKTKEGWRVFVARGSAPRAFEQVEPLDLPAGFCHPAVARDGLTMYLQGPLENGRLGLFVTRRARRGAAWDKPVPLVALNHKDAPTGDRSPALSFDGAYLYFASDRPGGKGGLDLYAVSTAELRKASK
jgi:hypothetical protein